MGCQVRFYPMGGSRGGQAVRTPPPPWKITSGYRVPYKIWYRSPREAIKPKRNVSMPLCEIRLMKKKIAGHPPPPAPPPPTHTHTLTELSGSAHANQSVQLQKLDIELLHEASLDIIIFNKQITRH